MAVVIWDSEGSPVELLINASKYLLSVASWWKITTGRNYNWSWYDNKGRSCALCAVPLKPNEMSMGTPDNIVCFECVEIEYLEANPTPGDTGRSLLDPFRTVEEEA